MGAEKRTAALLIAHADTAVGTRAALASKDLRIPTLRVFGRDVRVHDVAVVVVLGDGWGNHAAVDEPEARIQRGRLVCIPERCVCNGDAFQVSETESVTNRESAIAYTKARATRCRCVGRRSSRGRTLFAA